MPRLTFTVLATLALALQLASLCVAEPVLHKAAVIHRHGARTPAGQLTPNGIDMCRSVGSFLNATLDYLARLGIPSVYNVSFMHSEATEYPRVVVSGEAFVMGLLADSPQAVLPFVDFVPKAADTKLVMWHSWPTWIIRDTYAAELHVDDAYVTDFIGTANLSAIGSFLGLGSCLQQPTECISILQDTIACNVSAGNPVPAAFLENWDSYRIVVSRFFSRLFGYFPDDDYSAQLGSLGQIYVSDVLSFFDADESGPLGLMKLKHTAAHDWTLLAVYSTLGIWTPSELGSPAFVPRFAETLIMELYMDSVNGSKFVRALRGFPGQAPPDFSMRTVEVAPMKCMSASGAVYNASGDYGCPAEDLARFVNASRPQADDNLCYATQDVMDAAQCLGDAAPPAGSPCLFYRMNCPREDCGKTAGAIADPANGFGCQSSQLNKGTAYYTATVIALVAPSLLGGAIFGFYGVNRLRRLLWRTKDAKLLAQAAQ